MNIKYTPYQEKRIRYLLKRMSELPQGHTISPIHMEGYPFASFLNQYGKTILTGDALKEDIVYKYMEENPQHIKKIDLIELAWKYQLVNGTPNGDLYKHSSDFENLNQKRGLPLVHITTHLDEIKKTGQIYQSMGCLGASVYCTPLSRDYKLHNLAQYMYEVEFPNYFEHNPKKRKPIQFVLIWLENENFIENPLLFSGIDYLYMGQLQLNLYKQFKSLYLDEYRESFLNIESSIIKKVTKVADFLQMCAEYKLDNITNNNFIKIFNKSIIDMPFLGYLYFEVLSEYISMYQNDYKSMRLHERGEINNYNYKNLVYDLCPQLKTGFKLIHFHPRLEDVISYLKIKSKEGSIITDFLEEHFMKFFKWRFAQYVRSRLLDTNDLAKSIDIKTLAETNPSIVGHLLHREIRENKYTKEKSYLYDIFRAKKYWQHWNDTKVPVPYNSILPKGEIGINPTFKDLSYKVYECELDPKNNTLKILQEINAKITPNLVGNEFNSLRKHTK